MKFLSYLPLVVLLAACFLLGAFSAQAAVTSYTRDPAGMSFDVQTLQVDVTLDSLDTNNYALFKISGPGGAWWADTACLDISSTTQTFNDILWEFHGDSFRGAYSQLQIVFFSNSTCTTHAGQTYIEGLGGTTFQSGPIFMMTASSTDDGGTTVTVEDSLFSIMFFAILLWIIVFAGVFYIVRKFAT